VLVHQLYPRSLLALFNDSVADLTPADHRAYAMYAKAQRHKAAETIEVTFETPRTKRSRRPMRKR
jgi:hypothetical protein